MKGNIPLDAIELIFMILLPCKSGKNFCITIIGPKVFISNCCFKLFRASNSTGPAVTIPALFIKTSILSVFLITNQKALSILA